MRFRERRVEATDLEEVKIENPYWPLIGCGGNVTTQKQFRCQPGMTAGAPPTIQLQSHHNNSCATILALLLTGPTLSTHTCSSKCDSSLVSHSCSRATRERSCTSHTPGASPHIPQTSHPDRIAARHYTSYVGGYGCVLLP